MDRPIQGSSPSLVSRPVTEHGLARRLRDLSQMLSVVVGLIGAVVLVGWAADLPLLKSLSPNWVSMKANTALCFLLLGTGLFARREAWIGRLAARRVAVAAGCVVALIALATLVEYSFSVNLGLDQLLFREPLGTVGTLSPGRMAPTTAFCFAVVSVPLALLDQRRPNQNAALAQYAAVVAGAIAGQNLVSQFLGADYSVGLSGYTRMAVHTGGAFCLVALAVFGLRPRLGLVGVLTDAGGAGQIARLLLPAVVLGIVPLGLNTLGERVILYDRPFHESLDVIAIVVTGGAFSLLYARSLGRATDATTDAIDSLRASESRLQETLNGIGEAVISIDALHNVVTLNAAAEGLTGWRRENAAGRPVTEVFRTVDEATRQVVQDPIGRLVAGQLTRAHHALIAADGTKLPIAQSAAVRRASDGTIAGYVVLFRDATDDRAQQELQRQLEHQLQLSLRLEGIGRLAAGVAHEINTPIQFIGDNLDYVTRTLDPRLTTVPGSEDADLRGAMRDAAEGVRRVSEIVGAMKTFTHHSRGEKGPCDLRAQISATAVVCRGAWKNVATLEIAIPEALPRALGSADELNQVWLNLVVNAAQAIAARPAGAAPGLIRITGALVQGMVEIRVLDNGGGIPADAQGHVFEPFFTTKPVGQGTGQGLTISWHVVAEHGGTLTFETTEGEGTEFIVRLPVAPT